jgi:hypothetical protein
VHGTGSADGTADGYLIYWDNPTVQYSACPPPAGWSVASSYVWQSYNYLLVTGLATAYSRLWQTYGILDIRHGIENYVKDEPHYWHIDET